MALINKLRNAAHQAGAGATHVWRVALHGTRRTPEGMDANAALPARPAFGKMIHSVFEGPRFRRGAGPAVKRPRSA